MNRTVHAALAFVALALVARPPAQAASPWGKRLAAATKPASEQQRADLIARGDEYILQAHQEFLITAQANGGLMVPGAGAAQAELALGYYDRALAIRADADLYYRAFQASQFLDDNAEHYQRTLRYFDGLRAAAPLDPRENGMMPELLTALAKLGGAGGPDAQAYFERGVKEFELWRQRIDDTDPRFAQAISTYSTNAAELSMAQGPDHLDEAIEGYETGIQYFPGEPLGYYGAAVAYDRDGQWGKAAELMAKALDRDPPRRGDPYGRNGKPVVNDMARLVDVGVYFVPDGDIEYYFAIGYQVQGQKHDALVHYKAFLERLPDSPYAFRAKEHIAELEGGK